MVAAVAASASVFLLVRNARPRVTARLQPEPASGNIGSAPAAVYTLLVWNNGAAPLTVRVTLLLNGEPSGRSLDVGKHEVTIAAGGQHESWALAIERSTLDRSGVGALRVRIVFRWLGLDRTLMVAPGERKNY